MSGGKGYRLSATRAVPKGAVFLAIAKMLKDRRLFRWRLCGSLAGLVCTILLVSGGLAATENPIRLPDVTLIDAHGKPFSPASLAGKVVVVDFVHTTCPSMCQMLTGKLAGLAKKLRSEMGSKVVLLSVSNDPVNDQPAQLLAMARHEGADQPGWVFATGSVENVSRVLKAFGLSLRREADGEPEHIVKVFIVSPDGREAHEYLGLVTSDHKMLADIQRMAARVKAPAQASAASGAEVRASNAR
jgi:protein SCO1/2